jgi:tetratricopeptide (TPR) repeat protein
LYYADAALRLDPSNEEANGLRERVRGSLHDLARAAVSRGEMGEAKDLYGALVKHYPDDETARAAAEKLDSQLSSRKGEVNELVRKAEEAIRTGKFTEPARRSAHYYTKLALAIDPKNRRARSAWDRIRDHLVRDAERAFERGEVNGAIRQFEKAARLFPEDAFLIERLHEIEASRSERIVPVDLARERRLQGLAKYARKDYVDAISDLEYAENNNEGTAEVIQALGRCYLELGQLERADDYFKRVPRFPNQDAHKMAVAGLADIAERRGNTLGAISWWENLRRLGGTDEHSIDWISTRIDRLQKINQQKAVESQPVEIRVRHIHRFGTCHGTLKVDRYGVRYSGDDHSFVDAVLSATALVTKDGLTVAFSKKSQKFRAQEVDAVRFEEALSRFKAIRRD